MCQLEAAASSLRRFGVLMAAIAMAFIALGLGLGLGLSASGVLASHDDPDTIHACVNPLSKVARIVEDPARCAYYDDLVEWQGAGGTAALEARISTLETQLTSLQAQLPDCLSTADASDLNTTPGDAIFEGCNVHVRSGSGTTDGTVNGLGNLIVGYNDDDGDARTGSHNLVVGPRHSYTSYGGFVAGADNTISGASSSVSGGRFNTASAIDSSVSGGAGNIASGVWSSVSGGVNNIASGGASSISGGDNNRASGANSSITSGTDNEASGFDSSVVGGTQGAASGELDTVIGDTDGAATIDAATGSLIFADVFIP